MKFKRITAYLTALSILSVPGSIFAEAKNVPDDYVFYLSFDESGAGSGSYSATKGGNVNEHGNICYETGISGNALKISEKSNKNYLSLPDGILDGKTSATYTFWLKPESDTVPNWPFMATPEDSHSVGTEKYVGMLATTESYTVERYNNSGTRISSVSCSGSYDEWKYVTVIFDNSSTVVYINGMPAVSGNKTVDLSEVFTANSKTFIGHANWGDGEGFQGMIDEFRIYPRALEEEEIAVLAGDAYTRELDKLLNAYNRLDINTNFFCGNEKVFSLPEWKTVTAKTNVSNLKPEKTDISISVACYTSDDTEINGSQISQTYSLDILEKAEFSKNITPTENTAYCKVTVCENPGTASERIYDAGRISKSDVIFPSPSPADSADTTEGVHDPSVFKDPVSGKYYVYSTHNLIFESSDLINWKKYDYTDTISVPESARNFRIRNFDLDDAPTYWAPDIYYKADDEYPYWFYLSVSGFGSIQSAISLVKAKTPLLWGGEYKDCGVVIASDKGFDANCIDANIYTETDGNVYFFWGSFSKGIYVAQLDADTGFIKGVDYTNDQTLLATSKTVGTRMYAVPKGVVGPEGAYVIYNEDTGYRYMFVSCGYLGTNYNIRVARTDVSFTDILSKGNTHTFLLDHQGRRVGTSYAEQDDTSELWGYKMSGSFQLGDGIEYLGSGHNSVFQDDDGSWYLVQHCRKVADGIAYLQVKKILWTEDGWPVISPMVYSGETEQQIPEDMLYGTWDLSSVGQSVFADGVSDVSARDAYRGCDMPVHSSKIILSSNGTIANGLGYWAFNGYNIVTLNFTKDGDNSENEYFQNGDTMTLYVLAGYDKDKQEPALVMTGTDQNSVTQFAKKDNAVSESTAKTNASLSVPDCLKYIPWLAPFSDFTHLEILFAKELLPNWIIKTYYAKN